MAAVAAVLALLIFGAALGVAVLSTLAAGYHLVFAIAAGLAGASIVVAVAVLWPSRRRAALAECC